MIRSDIASLVVRSDVLSVAEVTAMLQTAPDASGDIGDPVPGRDRSGRSRLRRRTYWSMTRRADASEVDDTGTSALRELTSAMTPHAEALALIRDHGETTVWWSGLSDSTQGGFVMSADLVADLATLGCDLFGTVHLDDDGPATR